MEDTYACVHDLLAGIEDLYPTIEGPVLPCTYYAVFDGHGGKECSTFLAEHLHNILRKAMMNRKRRLIDTTTLAETVTQCIKEAFVEADELFQRSFPEQCDLCGATAVVVLIIGNRLFCANLGDARAVLCRQGKAINLSVDHKANREDEQERIKGDGGYIVFGRVLGRLAITRAFGDFDCKNVEVENNDIKSFILNDPEIREATLDPFTDEFLLMGSDGLYDKYSSQEAVNVVRKKLADMPMMEQDPQQVAAEVVREILDKRMVSDNITVIIATFNRGIEIMCE